MTAEAFDQFAVEGIAVELVRKRVRNMHLRVRGPAGDVRVSAPLRMSLDTIRRFVLSKLGWIRKHQSRLQRQPVVTPIRYLDGESHRVWGQPYPLKVIEAKATPSVELTNGVLVLRVRPGSPVRKREAVLEAWFREQVRNAAPPLFRKWEPLMGVGVGEFLLRRMRSRWGTCNTVSKSIRLNTELAKNPPACLEYVVVHEMTHLLEPSHNRRFVALMNRFMPDWATHRRLLNRSPSQSPTH